MPEKNKWKKDYEVEEIETKGRLGTKYRKELIYKGNYYSLKSDRTKMKRLTWVNVALMCLIGAVFAIIGTLNNEGSRKFYIIVPYVFMFLPIFYGFLGAVKLLNVKTKMTLVEYEHTVDRIKKSSLSLVIMTIATIIGQVIYLVRHKITDVKSLEYAFLSGIVLIGGLALMLLQLQNRYEFVEENQG